MTDIPTLAAQRCAELANAKGKGLGRWTIWSEVDFGDEHGTTDTLAFCKFVEQAHHLATEALVHPERAAEILGPMILVEPVDAVEELARRVWEDIASTRSDAAAISIIAEALRQREGTSNG